MITTGLKRSAVFAGTVVALVACGKASQNTTELREEQSATVDPLPTETPKLLCEESDLLKRLNCIEGMKAVEVTVGVPAGYRRFDLAFEQPTDHANSKVETFKQKLVLLHKQDNAPMILHTSGYAIFSVGVNNVTRAFDANQVQVEHRFFAGSTPQSKDWTKLDIRQSAADFHRVTLALKYIYTGRWLNTGASKGGMTSIYHHRFYPTDMDGTLALVAPMSYSTTDQRYVTFVDNVGGEKYAGCRMQLEALQAEYLKRRGEMTARMEGEYDVLGSADIAFEHTILEMPFIFWQYKSPEDAAVGCKVMPKPDAASDKLYSWLEQVNNPTDYGDESIQSFQPYYYQAARELGSPASKMSHLTLAHAATYKIESYLPAEAPTGHDPAAMNDVTQWVAESSDRIMYVYGEFDPWSAGAYTARPKVDSHSFTVPTGHHGSNVFLLPTAVRTEALATLGRWLNKSAVLPAGGIAKSWVQQGLEAKEVQHFRGR